ncbi:hypothetical protein COU74_00560 [Candidatus Peregrinibacteria bacterium CG10_big_fil_rev_8_21_14_0_10_36_19]|nr:MAG: hypothetical protein COU74_00560 [Candidatus Peregrinibacteria bacterium CG10_big_fil_rev_8_21_14_0_10_36_19]
MSFFPKKIVGVDIHDYSAELVELKIKGEKVILEAYNRVTFDSDMIRNGEILKPEEMKVVLKSLFETAKPRLIQNDNVALIFPSAKIFSHIFKLPGNLNAAEIRKTLPYESESVIPFSIDDVYWDFSVLYKETEADHKEYQYVLFASIKKDVVDKYAKLFQDIGITPSLFGADVESLKYGVLKQLDLAETSLVIDVGTLSTNFLVLKGHLIRYFFGSNKGGKELIKSLMTILGQDEVAVLAQKESGEFNGKALPKITSFIESNFKLANRLIVDFNLRKKAEDKISKIFITGEFLNLPGFYDLAKKHFKNYKIVLADPRAYLVVDEAKFQGTSAGKVPYSTYFLNAVGIALRGVLPDSKGGINLLPNNLKESIAHKKNYLWVAVASVLISVISLFVATFIFFKYQELNYGRLNLEIQKSSVDKLLYGTRYQQIRDEINHFNNEVNELSNIDNTLFSVSQVLREIKSSLPYGVTLSGIKFDDSRLIIGVTGVASDRAALLKATKNLKELDYVDEVISPISSFDEKVDISFFIELKLVFKNLPKYGSSAAA